MPSRPRIAASTAPPPSGRRRRGLFLLVGIGIGLLLNLLAALPLSSWPWRGSVPGLADAPPDLLMLMTGGMFGGLAGLALFAGLRPRSARRFQREEEIEAATDLPVLARLPELAGGDALDAPLRNLSSAYANGLRALHAKLRATSPPDTPLTVAIASAEAGEGRSTLAAGLGRLLASEGHRVLLIDCDWRHPDQHHLFRVPHDGGLTRLLENRSHLLDEVIHTDPLSGLDFVTTGRDGRLGARMLLSDPMQQTLAACTRYYELVILDLPPVLAAGEVLLLSRLVDRILFVVRWNHITRSRAMAALTRLRKARGRVAGIALTRVAETPLTGRSDPRFGAVQHPATTE